MLDKTPNLKKHLETAKKNAENGGRKENFVDLFIVLVQNEPSLQNCFIENGYDPIGICEEISKLFDAENLKEIFQSDDRIIELNEALDFLSTHPDCISNGFIGTDNMFMECLIGSEIINAWFQGIKDLDFDSIVLSAQDLIDLSIDPSEEELNEIEQEMEDENIRYCSPINPEEGIFEYKEEIEKVIGVLGRKNKKNAVLIGDDGIGKKSLIKAVVNRIEASNIPDYLDRPVFKLDLHGITAGASLMGVVEARFRSLKTDLEKAGDCILVIEDIHDTIAYSRDTQECFGSIKDILSLPGVCCIGTSNSAEFRKASMKDKSILNIFEQVQVHEPSAEKTKELIKNIIPQIEKSNDIKFEDGAANLIVDLCSKYKPYGKFPGKFFDTVDELASKLKGKSSTYPEDLKKAWIKCQNKIIEGKSVEESLKPFVKKVEKWRKSKKLAVLSKDFVISECAKIFKLPENQISEGDESIISLCENIKKNVFGQDHVIDKISDYLMCSKAGIRDFKKPVASFFFVGPTSVGKTEIAKNIAQYYFGSNSSFLRINMSEFSEKFSVSSLVGAPAGYKDSDMGGRFEFVKNNPSCVVLFDEIEKAHPDVHNLLLQIMDDGKITDSLGFDIDFTNTIVILTGNSGSEATTKTMGFIRDENKQKENHENALKKDFRPELLSRIDEVLTFNKITDDVIEKIVSKSLQEVAEKVSAQGITVSFDNSVSSHVFKRASKEESHARAVKKIVRTDVTVPLAKFMVLNKGKNVSMKFSEGKVEIFEAA